MMMMKKISARDERRNERSRFGCVRVAAAARSSSSGSSNDDDDKNNVTARRRREMNYWKKLKS